MKEFVPFKRKIENEKSALNKTLQSLFNFFFFFFYQQKQPQHNSKNELSEVKEWVTVVVLHW